VTWLSETLGLPSIYVRPDILIGAPVKLTAARSNDLDEVGRARDGAQPIGAYDDFTRTVYLPRGWSPDKPGDQSVLVHQIVYHLQSLAGMKYECPQERARVAFEAQALWLWESGQTLVSEFGIDPDALLLMTECYIP
jgi:Domain of unknown function (DUF6647)